MGKIAAIFPSRGLSFSETVEEMLVNLQHSGHAFEVYFAHGKPIPDCFNEPLTAALRDTRNQYFWFVEDDMILGYDILDEMMDYLHKHKCQAVAVDYPVTDGGGGAVLFDGTDSAFFTGTGCLLVTRSALEKMPRPVFRADVGFALKFKAECLEATPYVIEPDMKKKVYGMHDIYFGFNMYIKGMPIQVMDHPLGQRKLSKMGADATNYGYHQIRKLTELKSNLTMVLNRMWAVPAPATGMVEVKGDDGTVFFIRKTHNEGLDSKLSDAHYRVGNLIITDRSLLE